MFPVYGIPYSCTYVYNYLYLLGTHAMANNCVLETAAKLAGVGFEFPAPFALYLTGFIIFV